MVRRKKSGCKSMVWSVCLTKCLMSSSTVSCMLEKDLARVCINCGRSIALDAFQASASWVKMP